MSGLRWARWCPLTASHMDGASYPAAIFSAGGALRWMLAAILLLALHISARAGGQ